MATPNQDIVLGLDKDTVERLMVEVADYLRNIRGVSLLPLYPELPKSAAATLVSKL